MDKRVKLKKPEKIVVYEDMWGVDSLCSRRGMCCLGFACAAQMSAYDLTDHTMPNGVCGPGFLVKKDNAGRFIPTQLAEEAANINDSSPMDYGEKKKKLKSLFSKNHVKLIFKEKAPKAYRTRVERQAGFKIIGNMREESEDY